MEYEKIYTSDMLDSQWEIVKEMVTIQSPKNSTMLKVKKEDKKKSSNCR